LRLLQRGRSKGKSRGAGFKILQIDIAAGDGLGIVGKFAAKLVQLILGGLQLGFKSLVVRVGATACCFGVRASVCCDEDAGGVAGGALGDGD